MQSVNSSNNTPPSASLEDKRSWLDRLSSIMLNAQDYIKHRLSLYIGLIKIYTPLGSLLESYFGPKSLEQWHPTKQMPPNFLSATIPLPNPDKLSLKAKDTSRITAWATRNLLHAGRLASRALEAKFVTTEQIDDKIKQLTRAIVHKKKSDIYSHANDLIKMLKANKVSHTLPPESRSIFLKQLDTLSTVIGLTETIHQFDDSIQNISNFAKSPPDKSNIKDIPTIRSEFLRVALEQALPEMKKETHTSEITREIQNSLCRNRGLVECKLHLLCKIIEPSTLSHIQDQKQYAQDTMKRLYPDAPLILPHEHTQDILIYLQDVETGRKQKLASALIALENAANRIFPKEFHGLDRVSKTPSEVSFKILSHLNDNPDMLSKLIDHLNDMMSTSLKEVGQYINSALQQRKQYKEETTNSIVEELILNNKFNQSEIQQALADITNNKK